MKRILILGVNGFIGHHLSQRIVGETGWEIYGMDMQTDRIADLLREPRFHFFEGDITINREWIEYHVKKCDVVLPLVAPGLVATSVFAFIQAWNEYIFASVILTDQRNHTITVWLSYFLGTSRNVDWGALMAASTLTAIPVVIFFLLVQRRIAFGLTSGAVKG